MEQRGVKYQLLFILPDHIKYTQSAIPNKAAKKTLVGVISLDFIIENNMFIDIVTPHNTIK